MPTTPKPASPKDMGKTMNKKVSQPVKGKSRK